jgi:RNA polymerase sigma factor (sigma-70 family)
MRSGSARVGSLVRAAQAGDERAFEELVRSFQDLAVAYATALLGDYHLAEDAAQEAFLDAYRLLGSLRDPDAFAAWLRRIVFKRCDRITRRAAPALTGLEAALEVAGPQPSPAELLEARETTEALRAAITTLSDAEQQVVLLYYMGDQSQAQVAAFLSITPNAVKTRLYSARQRLRAHMTSIEQDLGNVRPSGDPGFAEKVRRLIQPEALWQKKPWMWSPGIGTDVWEMFCACIAGDLETVKDLLGRDPSLVRAHYEYRTPLSFAVRENQLHVAEYLLDHGALRASLGDPVEMARDRGYHEMVELLARKIHDHSGASTEGVPVAEALKAYDLPLVRRLLDEQPALLHARDDRSSQPIHWAVMTRNLDAIDELIRRGADPNSPRGDGALPIHLTNGDYDYRGWRDVPPSVTTTPDDVYRRLVARGAEVDLGMAAFKGDERRVRELLARDPSLANRVSGYNSYYIGCGAPLKNAAAGGNLEIVKLLLEHGADPNLPEEGIAPQGHALYSAVYNRHYEIAKLLLEHGAYPNPQVESSADAVWIAIGNGDLKMLGLLGSHGARMLIPNRLEKISYAELKATGVGMPPEVLAYYGDLEAITALLASDPSLASAEALSMAAQQGHPEVVQLLLAQSPELAKEVTVSKPRALAELLFEHGMDPNRPNWLRKTPLMEFAGSGDVESAALFLDHGADLHARDEEQRSTPLAWAAMRGQERMVELLLRRGAQLTLPDGPPWATPLAWATRRGHAGVVKILTEYGSRGALPARSVASYEALAQDLVDAYGPGDEQALARIIQHFRIERPLTWDRPPLHVRVARLRRAVNERLQTIRQTPTPAETLSLEDARMLIALSEGFAAWPDLARSVGGPNTG